MEKILVLYNPIANNGRSREAVETLVAKLGPRCTFCDVTKGYAELLAALTEKDAVLLCGGDGTLNRFINDTEGLSLPCDVLYYASGSGNDFARDISLSRGDDPVSIKRYLRDLPEVEVKGRRYRFLNGVGYGIDGYCCQVGDELRAIPGKKVDYTAIAIKGLLGKFKPKNAKVTVDGETHTYHKVWLAPTMNGRYYGGGMIATPEQDRLAKDGVSLLVWHGSGSLKTLMLFPSIFKGEHVKHTKHTAILRGREIEVVFDSPCALQIDGETVLDVTSYRVTAPTSSREAEAEQTAARV